MWLLVSFLKGSADGDDGCCIQARTPYRQARHAAHPPFPPSAAIRRPPWLCRTTSSCSAHNLFLVFHITCSLSYVTETLCICCLHPRLCYPKLILLNMNFVSPLVVSCLCVCVIPTHDLSILNLTVDSFLAAVSIFPFHLPISALFFFSVSICHSVRLRVPSQRKPYRKPADFSSTNMSASIKKVSCCFVMFRGRIPLKFLRASVERERHVCLHSGAAGVNSPFFALEGSCNRTSQMRSLTEFLFHSAS